MGSFPRYIRLLSKFHSIVFCYVLLHMSCLYSDDSIPKETIARIYAHLTINDTFSACENAKQLLVEYPLCKELHIAYIASLAKSHDEKELFSAWHNFSKLFPESAYDKDTIEILAWGILEKGAHSQMPIVRLMAALGAFFSQDAKGVTIVCKCLNDNNSLIRGIATELACNMYDKKMQSVILSILKKEKKRKVRLQAIAACGKMRMLQAKDDLMCILACGSSDETEVKAAVGAIAELYDKIDRNELAMLANHHRREFRLLACQLCLHFDAKDGIDLIGALLNDGHPSVRAAALQTIGLSYPLEDLKSWQYLQDIRRCLNDSDPLVSASAAWLLIGGGISEGKSTLCSLLQSKEGNRRRIAAGALCACGNYVQDILWENFNLSQDQYIRANLAQGLLANKIHTAEACNALCELVEKTEENLSWQTFGIFRVLAPAQGLSDEYSIDESMEMRDQLLRLELLNILAIHEHPHTQQAVKNFLTNTHFGVTGAAAALLLTEGDETALDVVKTLLSDSCREVRLQAALVLAIWGRDEDVICQLKEAWSFSNRQMKERILEALGRIGATSTVPFLVERLQEPYQTLRIIAAAALLQTLYH